jgi:hypothetical protein
VRLEGLGKLKGFNDFIVYRANDIPACSLAPEPCTLPGMVAKGHKLREGILNKICIIQHTSMSMKNTIFFQGLEFSAISVAALTEVPFVII